MDPASPASDSRITTSLPPAPVNHPAVTPTARDVSVERPSPWPRSAQWTTAVLLGVVLLVLGIQVGKVGRDKATTDASSELLLDLNRATRAELLQVPGIGPALADRIVAYRLSHGHFREIDDLRRVPGIGAATLQRLRAYVFIQPPLQDAASVAKVPPADAPKRAAKSKKEHALAGQVININRAGLEELQKLPGIGAKLSQRIVDERGKRPFASVNDLRRVSGIGPKTLAKIRPFIAVDDAADALASVK